MATTPEEVIQKIASNPELAGVSLHTAVPVLRSCVYAGF